MRMGLWLVAIAGAAHAAPRPGHAVRVELAHHASGPLRLCGIDGTSGFCFGPRPQVGDALDIIDTSHPLGTVHVVSVDSPGKCEETSFVWKVAVDQDVVADQPTESRTAEILGISGMTLDPRRAHMIKDSHLLPDRPSNVYGVDADGDDVADAAFAISTCGDRQSALCLDVYTRGPDQAFVRERRDMIPERCIGGM